MKSRTLFFYTVSLVVTLFLVSACNSNPEVSPELTVNFLGAGSGTVSLPTPGADYRQDFTEPLPTGTTVAMTAAADDDSIFVGWEGDCSNPDAATCEVVVDVSKNVRAIFAKKTYTLTLQPEGTGTGQTRIVDADGTETLCREKCERTFAAGTELTLAASADQGSSFTSWGQDCVATGTTCDLVVDAPKTVTATFDKVGAKSFDLVVTKTGSGTVNSDPAGIDCGSDCRETYAKDSVVTLTAVPAAGWTFGGWSDGCVGTGACRVTMSTSKTVTATFTEKQVQLTLNLAGTGTGRVTSEPAGLSCPATCTASFDDGTQVTLSAAPEAGSSFSGWSGACAGTSTCTVTLTGTTNVMATFAKKDAGPATYPLSVVKTGSGSGTVSSTPSGIDCGGDCTENFPAGTTVSLSASANTGSVFSSWQNCPSVSGNVCYVAVNADTQVTAVFAASGTVRTIKVPIRATDPNNARVSTDDAEQFLTKPSNNALPANATDTKGGDLDLAYDTLNRTQQLVGLRFHTLNIPQGATITNAYIQFISDEDYAHSTYPTLNIKAEADPNAATFVEGALNNISDRPVTAAQVMWQPPLWGYEATASAAERSPDLSALVQEVVDYPDWNASSALVFIISGEPGSTNHRAATSREDTDGPAQLFVTYSY